jgi:hypothetical protein
MDSDYNFTKQTRFTCSEELFVQHIITIAAPGTNVSYHNSNKKSSVVSQKLVSCRRSGSEGSVRETDFGTTPTICFFADITGFEQVLVARAAVVTTGLTATLPVAAADPRTGLRAAGVDRDDDAAVAFCNEDFTAGVVRVAIVEALDAGRATSFTGLLALRRGARRERVEDGVLETGFCAQVVEPTLAAADFSLVICADDSGGLALVGRSAAITEKISSLAAD